MTDSISAVDKLVGKESKPKAIEKVEPKVLDVLGGNKPEIIPVEDKEPELQMEVPERTKRDKMSDEILDVMLNDDNLEKMTHLNSKSAMVFSRADTMAEIFESPTLKRFSTKAKQHLVSNKRLGRVEVSEVLTNVGDTVDESQTLGSKLFGSGDTF